MSIFTHSFNLFCPLIMKYRHFKVKSCIEQNNRKCKFVSVRPHFFCVLLLSFLHLVISLTKCIVIVSGKNTGSVCVSVCVSVCLSVCIEPYRQNYWTDFDETFRKWSRLGLGLCVWVLSNSVEKWRHGGHFVEKAVPLYVCVSRAVWQNYQIDFDKTFQKHFYNDFVLYVKVWIILISLRHSGHFVEKMVLICDFVFLTRIFWQFCITDLDKTF